MSNFLKDFVRVTSGIPCPRCGAAKWCVIHTTGEWGVCQRVESDWRYGAAGWRYEIDDKLELPATEEREDSALHDFEALTADYSAVLSTGRRDQLARQWGVSDSALARLRVGWDFNRQCYSLPMRNGENGVIGIQFRSLAGRKWALSGSQLGLFVPVDRGVVRLLFIAEGASDCAALLSSGLEAVGRPNANCGSFFIREHLRFTPLEGLIIVADNDPHAQGIRGAKQLADEFLGAAVIRPVRHKDAREAIAAGGGATEISHAVAGGSNHFWERVTKWPKPNAA